MTQRISGPHALHTLPRTPAIDGQTATETPTTPAPAGPAWTWAYMAVAFLTIASTVAIVHGETATAALQLADAALTAGRTLATVCTSRSTRVSCDLAKTVSATTSDPC